MPSSSSSSSNPQKRELPSIAPIQQGSKPPHPLLLLLPLSMEGFAAAAARRGKETPTTPPPSGVQVCVRIHALHSGKGCLNHKRDFFIVENRIGRNLDHPFQLRPQEEEEEKEEGGLELLRGVSIHPFLPLLSLSLTGRRRRLHTVLFIFPFGACGREKVS